MKFLAIVLDQDNNLLVEEQNGSLTRLVCPFNEGRPCGFSCPHCDRPAEYGPVMGPGYYLDLHCGARTTRLEAQSIARKRD